MEYFLGQIALFPYTYAPAGWALCDGSMQSIMGNQALFSLLGIQFGGDGQTDFALPNLPPIQPKEGPEVRYYIAVEGVYPSRP